MVTPLSLSVRNLVRGFKRTSLHPYRGLTFNNVFVKGQASTSRKMLRNKVGKQTMERIEMVEAGYEHYKRYYPNGEGIDPNNRYYKIGQRVAEILNPTTHPNY
jgi:hypothetical protein